MHSDEVYEGEGAENPGNEPEGYDGAALTPDVQNLGMLCHLTALAGVVIPGLGFVLGPLIVWLLKKDDHPFIDEQGKESVNFQISMLIYIAACGALFFLIVPLLLIPVLAITDIVLAIIAAVKASNGESYRYPLTIRLLK